MQLCVIRCNFQPERDSATIEGLAICSDPDTPVTFIHADGSAYPGADIWTYRLLHYSPWMKFN